jgi:hypothetical protein
MEEDLVREQNQDNKLKEDALPSFLIELHVEGGTRNIGAAKLS